MVVAVLFAEALHSDVSYTSSVVYPVHENSHYVQVALKLGEISSGYSTGVHTQVIPLPLKQEARGIGNIVFGSYKQDWYNRIHLTPKRVNIGNLLSEVSRDFNIWNAYLVNTTLNSIVELDTSGITLVKPVVEPIDFLPLQEHTYSVAVSTTGPSTINGSYTYNFNTESVVLEVTGSRVTVLPNEPDWGKGITERFEWLTNVIKTYNGSETRAKLRHIPRKVYEYEIVVHKDNTRKLNSLLVDWHFRSFAIPVWTDGAAITSQVSSGGTVINVDTTNRDYVVGGSVILVVGDNHESSEILSFTDTSITVAIAFSTTWPVGTKAYPVRIGRIPKTTSTAFITTQTGRMKVRLQVDANDNLAATDVVETYRSIPILIEQPNYSGNITNAYESKTTEIDNSISQPVYEVETPNIMLTTDFIWLKKTKEDIYKLKEWLHARYGRLKTIWVPTWNVDMEVYDSVLVGSTVFNIKNINYSKHAVGKMNRRDIMIHYVDGGYDTARILSSVDYGSYEEILTDNVSSQIISPDNVKMISYVELKRLSSDALEFNWITPDVAKLTHKFVTVYYDV